MADEAAVYLLNEGAHIIDHVPKLWNDFVAFIKRGSFFDMATAMVVGGAFSNVVTSFVDDMFTPVISIFLTRHLSEMFVVIKSGPNPPYQTREQANADGAVTFNYGNFAQTLINFFVLSFFFYIMFKTYTRLYRDLDDNLDRLLHYEHSNADQQLHQAHDNPCQMESEMEQNWNVTNNRGD